MKRYNDFGNIPVHILTSGRGNEENRDKNALWIQLQKELLSLSSNSRQTLLDDAGHYLHLEQPEIVVDTIKEMIGQFRKQPNIGN